jgi:hypothetical protein
MPNLLAKIPYWETLIATLGETGGHAVAVGDFNTCRPYLDEAGAIDRTAHYMDKMAVRHTEERLRSRHRPHPRRFVVERGNFGHRRHGGPRNR